MLLTELLKLFSNNFDINEERYINIIQSNNIKLNQRLLVEVNFEKKINNNTTNKINDAPTTNTKDNISETNLKKKESSGRGRGRPRKTCEVREDESVLVEVEVIEIEGKEYYLTCENVIVNKELGIEGVLRDGKVLRKR